ncbi:hypothetical protein HCH54_007424 [Aspergillus fumigatus]
MVPQSLKEIIGHTSRFEKPFNIQIAMRSAHTGQAALTTEKLWTWEMSVHKKDLTICSLCSLQLPTVELRIRRICALLVYSHRALLAMIRRDTSEFLDGMRMEPPIPESFGALMEPILLSDC